MISQTCKYVLRAVTAIARHHEEGPILGRVIAEEMDIPLNYLHKILGILVHENILKSARGGGGGFSLNHAPENISLMMVMRPFDENLRVAACPFENPLCGTANPCPLHSRWVHLVRAYGEFLDNTNLRDIAKPDDFKAGELARGVGAVNAPKAEGRRGRPHRSR